MTTKPISDRIVCRFAHILVHDLQDYESAKLASIIMGPHILTVAAERLYLLWFSMRDLGVLDDVITFLLARDQSEYVDRFNHLVPYFVETESDDDKYLIDDNVVHTDDADKLMERIMK